MAPRAVDIAGALGHEWHGAVDAAAARGGAADGVRSLDGRRLAVWLRRASGAAAGAMHLAIDDSTRRSRILWLNLRLAQSTAAPCTGTLRGCSIKCALSANCRMEHRRIPCEREYVPSSRESGAAKGGAELHESTTECGRIPQDFEKMRQT